MRVKIFNLSIALGLLIFYELALDENIINIKPMFQYVFSFFFVIMLCMNTYAYKMSKTTWFWSHCLHKFWTITNLFCNTLKLCFTFFDTTSNWNVFASHLAIHSHSTQRLTLKNRFCERENNNLNNDPIHLKFNVITSTT